MVCQDPLVRIHGGAKYFDRGPQELWFGQAGDVERLKVLRNPDGSAKGVCFVTFRTEDQACGVAGGWRASKYWANIILLETGHV